MTLIVRRAVLADAERIGKVHARVWRETYPGIHSDEWIANVSDDERIAKWKTNLGEPNAARQWVAVVDGEIVGFAVSGPPRDDHPVRSLELWSIHLLKSHARTGVGTALVAASIGDAPASVWLVKANRPAQRFYEALGFAVDGAHEVLGWWENLSGIRMTR